MQINEEVKYKIILKKGYRILYIAMGILAFVGTVYFGILTFCEDRNSIIVGFLFTVILFGCFLLDLYGLTKKCERYKGKVVYSALLIKREYKLSEIASCNESVEEFSVDQGDGNSTSSYDKVTTFYDGQGNKLFKFGLVYENVQLLANEIENVQKSISNSKRKRK